MDRRSTAALFALMLAGCGGGAGGGGGSSPSVSPPAPAPAPAPVPPPPAVAFALLHTTPADGASGVSRDAAPQASFNATLAQSSITSQTVRLLGPEGNPLDCTLTTNETSAQCTPEARLPGGTRFKLSVDAAVSDSLGRTLGAPAAASFTTAAQTWSAQAHQVGSLPYLNGGTRPAIAALASGNVMLAWHLPVAGADTLFAATYNATTNQWQAPVTVASGSSGQTFSSPSLAVSANGGAVLCWNTGDATPTARIARYDPAKGSWGQPSTIQVAPSSDTFVSSICTIDSKGNVAVLTLGNLLYAVRWDASSATWSTPVRLDHPASSPYILAPHLSVGPNDAVTAAWIQDDDTTARSVYFARFDANAGTWGAATLAGTNAMQYLDLTVDGTGALTFVWTSGQTLSAPAMVFASRWTAGSGVTTQTRLDDAAPDASGAGAATVSADPAGFATAAWIQGGALRAARFDPAKAQWSTASLVDNANYRADSVVDSVADVAGNVTVVASTGFQDFASQYRASEGRWLPAVAVDTPADGSTLFANDAVAAIDRAGNVTLGWFSEDMVGSSPVQLVAATRYQ